MLRLILSRLWQGLLVLLIVSALTFGLLATAGGDAFTALRSDPSITEQTVENLRRVYGLDQPLPVRYARWLGGVARGDMGRSFFYQTPVAGLLLSRLTNTLWLALVALSMACGLSLALGAWAARRAGSWVDRLCELIIVLAASTPRLVLALAALVFAAQTSLFAVGSTTTGASSAATSLARLLLCAFVLCVPLLALFLAQTREGVGAALREDFVQVARAKGLPERVVIMRHALRAALNPLITIFGYSIGFTISGSVVVETVLNWPGLGQLSVVAVRSRDVPLLLGVVLTTASAVLAGNLLADILLRANDPRLRRVETRPDTLALSNTTNAPAA
jgi:peptide/nickel transport system permease protein